MFGKTVVLTTVLTIFGLYVWLIFLSVTLIYNDFLTFVCLLLASLVLSIFCDIAKIE